MDNSLEVNQETSRIAIVVSNDFKKKLRKLSNDVGLNMSSYIKFVLTEKMKESGVSVDD